MQVTFVNDKTRDANETYRRIPILQGLFIYFTNALNNFYLAEKNGEILLVFNSFSFLKLNTF